MAINNYTFDIPDPTAKLLQGLQTGTAFALIDQQRQMKALEMQQKQADIVRTKQMRSDLSMLADKPTAEAITQFQLRYPEVADKMDAGLKGLNANMQKRYIDDATQVMAAISSGQNDTALKILGEKADMFEQSGYANDAQSYKQMADIIKTNPKEAYASTALMLSKAMGVDKYSEMFDKLMTTRREQELQPLTLDKATAEAKKAQFEAQQTPERLKLASLLTKKQMQEIDSRIKNAAIKSNLDARQLQADIDYKLADLSLKGQQYKLNDTARKLINDSATNAVVLTGDANRMIELASKFENLPEGTGRGAFTSTTEWFAKVTGRQDELTLLQTEYTRLRMSEGLKLLPPGPATDKDVALALEGFLPPNADRNTTASFLRGMAKLNNYNAKLEEAKAEWVNEVGGLSKPKSDIDIMGIKVPGGTTFADFSKKYIKDLSTVANTETEQAVIPQRSYNRFNNLGQ